MYFKYPIIDTHIHVGDIEEINKAVKKQNMNSMCFYQEV